MRAADLTPCQENPRSVPGQPQRVLLIAGIDAVGVTRLPRLFTDAGFQVTVLASKRLAVVRSRCVVHHFATAYGPEATALAAREHLATHRGLYTRIILADEPTLWAAIDLGEREWLEGWFPVPLDSDSVDLLDSKVRFLVEAQRAGLNVPPFEVCHNMHEARRAASSLRYPVFVKGPRGLAGSGLRFAHNEADLESQLSTFSFEAPVVVQACVEGDAGSISVLYDHGRPTCWFSYLMKQTWPNRFSSASAAHVVTHPDAEALVDGVGAMTSFHGLGGIDWVWDRQRNRWFLLEFNPRPTPVYYLGERVGADFKAALGGVGAGKTQNVDSVRSRKMILLFPQNLYYSVEHGLAGQFLRTFGDAPWADPGLVLSHLRRFVTHYIPRLSR
jgi:predicted ATP-grasp superfamily ATP-dependent carboligase